MLPIAVFEDGPDRRRTKSVKWREFKLRAARAQGSETTKYGAEPFAPKWARSCIHGLGDGAEWIDNLFAAQGSYLLDFFHLSEHLAEAGKAAGREQGPVSDALRYMVNREDQLDYAAARQADLPIGSGMIQSGHRRLKIAGAWTLENAGNLARSRVAGKNLGLDRYWKGISWQRRPNTRT